MNKINWLITILILLFFGFTSGAKAVYAGPRLYFDPASANKSLNESFAVTVKVDSAGEIVGGVDGRGTYDVSRLELVSIKKASDMVFDSFDMGGGCDIDEDLGDGEFGFFCYSNSAVNNKAISGNLVVFNFKAKATGTAAVKFTCTSGNNGDSNIIKTSTSADIISCSENGSGSYTIGGESSASTSTPTSASSSTSTPTSTSTSTSTQLPQTGNVGVTVGLVVFGLISLLSAVFLKFL